MRRRSVGGQIIKDMIKKLLQENLPDAFSIIESVIRKMNAEKIEQWDEVYPNVEVLEEDIKKGEAYGFFDSTELKGFIVLNEEYSAEYDSLEWEACCGKSLIIHRLSVKANCQGQGIAKGLMDFSEEYARQKGYSSIRLDAFLDNKAALNLYEKRGYRKAGTVTFRKGLFNCYEKIL
jgi:ribosomal protein S18 acetylase RimI-like enzyme